MDNISSENNALALSEQESQLAVMLDGLAATGLQCRDMGNTFKKALLSARCMEEFRKALTPAVMKPIMALQGSPIGFRTDKDKQGGYPEEVVKVALISAAMMGLMPVGNQFNIISDRAYVTKEGVQFLLSGISGLLYDVDLDVPRMSNGNALVHARVVWSINGGEKLSFEKDYPVRVNAGQGADAVLGKAMRKACVGLYNKITKANLADGDASDEVPMKDVTPRWSGDAARERAAQMAGSGLSAAVPPAAQRRQEPRQEVYPPSRPAAGRVVDVEPRLPEEDGIPGIAPDEEEQQAAALDWMLRVLRDSGKSWQDVYRVMKANGWRRPEDGAPKSEMGAFSLWLFRDRDARKALEMHGFILGK